MDRSFAATFGAIAVGVVLAVALLAVERGAEYAAGVLIRALG